MLARCRVATLRRCRPAPHARRAAAPSTSLLHRPLPLPLPPHAAPHSTAAPMASAPAAPAPAPLKVLRRLDYAPPAWTTKEVSLQFDIREGATRVDATLHIARNGAAWREGAPLVLNRGIEGIVALVRVALDGKELAAGEYALDEKALTLTPPAGAERFTVSITTTVNAEANTHLEGLYKSGGIYCTQCEAEGAWARPRALRVRACGEGGAQRRGRRLSARRGQCCGAAAPLRRTQRHGSGS